MNIRCMMLMLALAGPTATLSAETNDLGTRQREVSMGVNTP
jgi:hypothetical protein